MLLSTQFSPDWPGERCGAKTRRGTPCPNPSMAGRQKCRLHGAAGGAPRGERNGNFKTGYYTQEALAARKARVAIRRAEMAELRMLERLGRRLGLFVD